MLDVLGREKIDVFIHLFSLWAGKTLHCNSKDREKSAGERYIRTLKAVCTVHSVVQSGWGSIYMRIPLPGRLPGPSHTTCKCNEADVKLKQSTADSLTRVLTATHTVHSEQVSVRVINWRRIRTLWVIIHINPRHYWGSVRGWVILKQEF